MTPASPFIRGIDNGFVQFMINVGFVSPPLFGFAATLLSSYLQSLMMGR